MRRKTACMDDLELAAYLEGRLAGKEKAAIDRHLQENRLDRRAFSVMRGVLTEHTPPGSADAPEYLIERAVHSYRHLHDALDVVLSIAKNILSIVRFSPEVVLMTPLQAGALRRTATKGATMTVVTKTFDDHLVEVGIERVPKNLCNFLVNVRDRHTGKPSGGLRAELVSGGREYASCRLKGGEAVFEDIRPGRYDIIIKQGEDVCGRLSIRIDD